jgi:hypothetical protein
VRRHQYGARWLALYCTLITRLGSSKLLTLIGSSKLLTHVYAIWDSRFQSKSSNFEPGQETSKNQQQSAVASGTTRQCGVERLLAAGGRYRPINFGSNGPLSRKTKERRQMRHLLIVACFWKLSNRVRNDLRSGWLLPVRTQSSQTHGASGGRESQEKGRYRYCIIL